MFHKVNSATGSYSHHQHDFWCSQSCDGIMNADDIWVEGLTANGPAHWRQPESAAEEAMLMAPMTHSSEIAKTPITKAINALGIWCLLSVSFHRAPMEAAWKDHLNERMPSFPQPWPIGPNSWLSLILGQTYIQTASQVLIKQTSRGNNLSASQWT